MSKKTKWILFSAIGIVLLFVLLSKMGVFGKDEGLKVTADKVVKKTIIETVNASGQVFPENEVKVTPEISGTITQLTVQEGDSVKKGQLLARIFSEPYDIQRSQAASGVAQSQAQVVSAQANLSSMQAQLDQAKKNYDMQKQLFDEKVISRAEFNTADAAYKGALASYNAAQAGIRGSQAGVAGARSSLARANTDLRKTAIYAPMSGVVSLLNVKQGEGVAGNTFNVGTEILRVADMDKIEVQVNVGENDIPKVKLGDTAIINVDAYADRKFKGIVTQIASSRNGTSVSSLSSASAGDVTQYKVHIRLLTDSYKDLLGKGSFPFRPGMTANADIQTKRAVDAWAVPVNAVTTREKPDSLKQSGSSNPNDDLDIIVFVKNADNTVSPVTVKTGIQDITYIEITEGLKGGEEIITGPYDIVNKTLKKGSKVKTVQKSELVETKK